jgi:hypothetical protein
LFNENVDLIHEVLKDKAENKPIKINRLMHAFYRVGMIYVNVEAHKTTQSKKEKNLLLKRALRHFLRAKKLYDFAKKHDMKIRNISMLKNENFQDFYDGVKSQIVYGAFFLKPSEAVLSLYSTTPPVSCYGY